MFARVFKEVLGDTPMRHLTDWRMTVARDLSRTQDVPLTEVADQVGYSSCTFLRRRSGDIMGSLPELSRCRPSVVT